MNKNTDLISIIVPCCNEEPSLPAFYQAVTEASGRIKGAEYEIIFIDDGSKDRTGELLRAFSRADSRCRYLSFSRNFGKEAAMYAGLSSAAGDYCVFMDADLQHPPELLGEMYHVLKTEDFDCCAGLRKDRAGENPLHTFLARSFYHVIGRACRLDMGDGKGDFRMMSRAMADSVLELKEYNRYMKGIFSFVGFETKWIPFHNVERAAGKSKWSLRSLFRYALDGILSFSSAPAALAAWVGGLLLLAALLTGIWGAYSGIVSGGTSGAFPVPGSFALVCLILALSGIQMLFLSLLGQYMAKDYLESKHRPIYIVKEKGGF